MTNQDWKLIFAEDIIISFTLKKNGIKIPLEYKFKQPTEDAQLELLSEITNLGKLTDFVSKENMNLDKMGQMDDKELIGILGKDKELIMASTELKMGYQKMMAKHFIKGTGYVKKDWKNFKDWYNSLEGVVRTKIYEEFIANMNDEKKRESIAILSDTTTME